MKKASFFCTLALLLASTAGSFTAQAAGAAPSECAARQGYWNIETNLTTRDKSIVRFYNAEHQLVYEEQLDGVCLDLSQRCAANRRTTRELNQALRHVLQHPEAARTPTLLTQTLSAARCTQRVYAAG